MIVEKEKTMKCSDKARYGNKTHTDGGTNEKAGIQNFDLWICEIEDSRAELLSKTELDNQF